MICHHNRLPFSVGPMIEPGPGGLSPLGARRYGTPALLA